MSFFQKNHSKSHFSIIIIIIALAAIYWSGDAYNRFLFIKYGVKYNSIREKTGLPLIGEDWEKVYSDNEINFINPDIKSGHRRKRVVIVSKGLPEEADLFFLPLNRGTIDMQFSESIAESKAMLFYNGRRVIIPYKQGIDTLKLYKLM
ncbi:MAG: hypothetical protein ACRYG7_06995 [Janthinobacterium lividum]